jgi:hydrogenase maturation protease
VDAAFPRTLVMGVGNPLMRDEGVGVRVAEVLMAHFDFPSEVEVIDAGTMGLGIINLFRDIDRLLVVDAVDGTGEPPGTVVRMTPEELAPNQVMHSLHDVRLADVLSSAELAGHRPDAECVGVQIERIEQFVVGLTPDVEAALPAAVSAVLTLLGEYGVAAVPRPAAASDVVVEAALRLLAERR